MSASFVSYAPGREDVLLRRALGDRQAGQYVEIGPGDPEASISHAFYLRGWTGLAVHESSYLAGVHRADRPRDTVQQIPFADLAGARGADQQAGPGVDELLTDAGLAGAEIAFLTLDAGDRAAELVGAIDLGRTRPAVMVIRAGAPAAGDDPLDQRLGAAGYRCRLFDGRSRFYLPDDSPADFAARFDYPVCVLDDYTTPLAVELNDVRSRVEALRATNQRLTDELADLAATTSAAVGAADRAAGAALDSARYWEVRAVDSWALAISGQSDMVSGATQGEINRMRSINHELVQEHLAIQRTLSWRITRPLRMVRGVPGRLRRLAGRVRHR